MDKNYYETLGIKRNASQNEIADSFRRLALVWHPKLSRQSQTTSQHYFSQVCEAYEVLSDPIKRAFYDKHGWRKLTYELYADAGLKGGYKFGNNSQEIFDRFFSSTKGLDHVLDRGIDNKGSMFNHAFGGLYYEDKLERKDLVVEVQCSLSQLYKGIPKNVKFDKKCLNIDGRTLSTQPQQKLLQIKPGYNKSTILRFKQQGDQSIQRKSSDLVFKIKQIPDQNYSRNGNDLIYTAHITLAQALRCDPLEIVTLDGRKLRVSLDQIPNPQELKQIQGQGMPIQDTKNKGNLYIKFDIKFPKKLPQQVKDKLRQLLN